MQYINLTYTHVNPRLNVLPVQLFDEKRLTLRYPQFQLFIGEFKLFPGNPINSIYKSNNCITYKLQLTQF